MAAAGAPVAPFFRFPDLQHPPQLLSYLGDRNIAVFSAEIDLRDFKIHKPDEVIKSVLSQLEKRDKGTSLMHDFQHSTAEALPELLHQLKEGVWGCARRRRPRWRTALRRQAQTRRRAPRLSQQRPRLLSLQLQGQQ